MPKRSIVESQAPTSTKWGPQLVKLPDGCVLGHTEMDFPQAARKFRLADVHKSRTRIVRHAPLSCDSSARELLSNMAAGCRLFTVSRSPGFGSAS